MLDRPLMVSTSLYGKHLPIKNLPTDAKKIQNFAQDRERFPKKPIGATEAKSEFAIGKD